MSTLPLRLLCDRGDRHQTANVEPHFGDAVDHCGRVLGVDARLLRFPPDVHLDQDGRREAISLRPGRSQRLPVHRVEEMGDGSDQSRLVRLEGTHEMPANVLREPARLLRHLLGSILAEVAMALLVDGGDGLDRHRLGDRHQGQGRRLTAGAGQRRLHPGDHALVAHATQAMVAWRSNVPLLR